MKQAGFYITVCCMLGPPARERISSEDCFHSSEQLKGWLAEGTVDEPLCSARTSATARHPAPPHNTLLLTAVRNAQSPKSGNTDCSLTLGIALGVCCPWFCLWITSKEAMSLQHFCQWFVRVRDSLRNANTIFTCLFLYSCVFCQIYGNLWPNKKSFPMLQWNHPVSAIFGWPIWLSLFTLKATERWEKNYFRDDVIDFLMTL